MAKHKAFIALGSNLHSPESQILRAFQAIEKIPKTHILKRSSLYQTPPYGYNDQPDFINAVAETETELSPEMLLQHLQKIELDFGRERPFPNAPRVLDLDLLLYDAVAQSTPLLTLPHPRMFERAFVLVPLAEIAPDLSHPTHGNIVELLKTIQNTNITKL